MTTWGWDTAAPLGSGSFGKVYAAYGPGRSDVAAKVIPKAKGTTREQLIAKDAPVSPHVVPIVYIEETADSFVLYMPRAEFKPFLDDQRTEVSAILKDLGLAE